MPYRKVNWYKKTLESLGYKVFKPPYSILGMYSLKTKKIEGKNPYWFQINQLYKYDVMVDHVLNKILIQFQQDNLLNELYSVDKNYLHQRAPGIAGLMVQILGPGMVFCQGDVWKRKRKIMTQVFNFDFLKSLIPQVILCCNKHFDLMQKNQKYPLVYIKEFNSQLFSEIVTKCFFGKQIIEQKINGVSYAELILDLTDKCGQIMLYPQVLIFGGKIIYLKHRAIFRQTCKKIKLYKTKCLQFVQNKIEKIKNQQPNSIHQNDMIRQILKYNSLQKDQTQRYSIEQIAHQFGLLFFAATDTSTHYLMMMLYFLDLNLLFKEKLQKQIDQVIKSDDDITYENLQKMQYLDCIQKETIRYYSPVPGILFREALKDHKHGNVPILKGTWLSTSFTTKHYNPNYFKDPQKFNPDRWLDKQFQKKLPSYALGGFGGGPRTCIGKHFALMQNKISLIKFMKRYNYQMTQKVLNMKWKLFTAPQKLYLKLQKK